MLITKLPKFRGAIMHRASQWGAFPVVEMSCLFSHCESQARIASQGFAGNVLLQSERKESISEFVVFHEHIRRGVPMPSNS